MSSFFSQDGPLSRCLANFEPRDGQRQMSEAVSEIIQRDTSTISLQSESRLLVVEAETGIGKTLAYIAPIVLAGKRAVISTATLNLQDQIMTKEVPLIEKAIGKDISVICIKGRQNYLCLYRWFQYRSASQMSLLDDSYCERIEEWLNTTQTGDRADLEWLPERSAFWYKISAHSNQCLGGDCPEGSNCFVNQVRKKAGSASLLVVNHHLFFSDLALRQAGFGEVLPRYEGVVFDEAHHIENVATTFFGKTFSQYQLLDLLADIERQAEADLDPGKYQRMVGASSGLKKRTEEFASLFPLQHGKFHLDSLVAQVSPTSWRAEVELLGTGLERLAADLADCSKYSEGWSSLEKRALELHANLFEIALKNDSGEIAGFVHWYERRERSVTLSATPVHVASHLQKTLYASVQWCIMTSATLSSGGDFKYFRERLGLGDSTTFLQFVSPFDYTAQSLIYVPEISFPEPADREYLQQACERACTLLQLSKGRGLVLCTSFRGMESMAQYLEEHLDFPVLVQGQGSRNALLKKFRDNNDSVLVAVASFWEGVDVQGESLSCVIIDKLPFEVPTDPVVQARVQAVTERGGNAFYDFQIPRAILTLRQGVGRLMRSATDRGVIAILDVRLFTKGYGSRFRKSLPPSPVVRSLEPVAEFYSQR
jgi:ATP-dependent DNA helicase DinG